jgi:pyruvate dehydrogenase E2 component (dihydrolipoamide acetyltransferase)
MARWEFKLPDIGEGVTEGEVVAWLVKPGDAVKEDQPMVEIMTDKATVTITSPKVGTILEARGKVGELVQVHGTLVVFDLGGAGQAGAEAAPAAAPRASGNGTTASSRPSDDGPAATAVGDIKESLPGMSSAPSARASQAPSAAPGVNAYFQDKPLATPATRKAARDLGVDLRTVPPTGPQGRVTKDDVEGFAKGGASQQNGHAGHASPSALAPSASQASAPQAANAQTQAPAQARELVKITPPGNAPGGSSLEERVPFAGMRRKIAQKMAQSKQTAAHFTFVEECDVSALKGLRSRLKPEAEAKKVKLTYLAFIAKAVVAALKKHPILNTALDESTNEIVYRKYVNLGIAASTDSGLIVPVIKDADRRSILDLAREIDRLASDAKNGKTKMEDLGGSTFTITSLGAQGGLFATPIINFPEVAILGVHQIKEKPVVKNGKIVIGEVMLLSLSFDHRIVDGHVGAAFAYEIIGFLENPDKLFLEMA